MMTTKKIVYLIDFFCQIEMLLLNLFKFFEIPGFFMFKKHLKLQIFLRVPGKLATLMIF